MWHRRSSRASYTAQTAQMANRTNPSVYLAGPISGQTQGGAYDWREKARKELDAVGITAFSPMRLEEYAEKCQVLPGMADKYGNVPVHVQGIVARDRNDCMTCDMVLCNLLPSSVTGLPSLGSVLEIAWADAFRVPMVVVMEDDGSNPNEHGMIRGISPYIVEKLEDGLSLVKAILLPYIPTEV